MDRSKVAWTVCHIAKSGGGRNFTSDNARYAHFVNTIKEAHRLYEKASTKWNEFFTEYSSLNSTNTITSVEQAMFERKRIIDSFKLPRKVPKNAAYAFQLFLGASECFAPDWKKSVNDLNKWKEYFIVCEKWVRSYFPNIVLSVAVHYDEKVPHMHVNLIPIRERIPIYHNEKQHSEDGSFLLNSKGKIITKKVMTVDQNGNPLLETRYTSGNFLNPDELVALQTDFAEAVHSFGVKRGIMNSQSRHEDLRISTRIHARKLMKDEERLKQIESAMIKKNDQMEARIAAIKHLLEVPFHEFKIIEPEKKAFPMLFNWELHGIKCKNFEEYRLKAIEEQVSSRLYQANLQVKNIEKRILMLSKELEKQHSINQTLTMENNQLKEMLFDVPIENIIRFREKRKSELSETRVVTETISDRYVQRTSR